MLEGPELGRALQAAMQLKGVRQDAVAREFGIKQPSVSEWIQHGRIAKKHISHLVEYFSDVVDAGHWGLDIHQGVAHSLSQAVVTVPPERIRISWRDIVSKPLPEHFSLEVQDDAMAPLLSKGDIAHFSTLKQPRAARPVLVVDRDDNAYIRNFEQGRGNEFRAVALAAWFQSMDSAVDGLRIVAVLTGWD